MLKELNSYDQFIWEENLWEDSLMSIIKYFKESGARSLHMKINNHHIYMHYNKIFVQEKKIVDKKQVTQTKLILFADEWERLFKEKEMFVSPHFFPKSRSYQTEMLLLHNDIEELHVVFADEKYSYKKSDNYLQIKR